MSSPSPSPSPAASLSASAKTAPVVGFWYFDHEQRYAHVRKYQVAYQLFCGAASGAITKTAIAPLERVKILLQLQGMSVALKGLPTDRGMWPIMRHIVREEGPKGLFKGNFANVCRVVPVYALKFTFNDHFRLMVVRPGQDPHALTYSQLLLSGTAAGLSQIIITYPLEVIRTRLALSTNTLSSTGRAYKGIIDCAVQTVRSEGPSGLYKGISATIWSGAPYTGLQMTCYDLTKRYLPSFMIDEETKKSNTLGKLTAGALSGLISQTITFPGDTVRRRMQTNGLNGKERMYTTSWDCMKKIWKNEGIRGYFRGSATNIVRCLPGAALQFAVFDGFKQLFGIETT